jgi:hypothetical protein
MYYSYHNEYPINWEDFPDRIRMPDGSTKTDKSTFTEDDLNQAGWKKIENPISYDSDKTRLHWEIKEDDSYGWVVRGIPLEEKEREVRDTRNNRIDGVMWRIYRHQRERRLGIDTTEKIEDLDNYMQQLADLTKQESFPWYINWPTEPY